MSQMYFKSAHRPAVSAQDFSGLQESWPPHSQGTCVALAGSGHFPNESTFTFKMPALRREETQGLVLRRLELEHRILLVLWGFRSIFLWPEEGHLHCGKDQNPEGCRLPPQRVNIPNRLLLDL